jgi:hypothetical protein
MVCMMALARLTEGHGVKAMAHEATRNHPHSWKSGEQFSDKYNCYDTHLMHHQAMSVSGLQ